MSLNGLVWCFAGGVLFHNLEEAIWFPRWSRSTNDWPQDTGDLEFACAACLLTGSILLLAADVTKSESSGLATYLISAVALAMVLNAIMPHLAFSLRTRTYMPGTATAWLLNVPLGCSLIGREIHLGNIAVKTFMWIGPCVVVAMAILMPVLLLLGRQLSTLAKPDQ
jgi:hypothetical protein